MQGERSEVTTGGDVGNGVEVAVVISGVISGEKAVVAGRDVENDADVALGIGIVRVAIGGVTITPFEINVSRTLKAPVHVAAKTRNKPAIMAAIILFDELLFEGIVIT